MQSQHALSLYSLLIIVAIVSDLAGLSSCRTAAPTQPAAAPDHPEATASETTTATEEEEKTPTPDPSPTPTPPQALAIGSGRGPFPDAAWLAISARLAIVAAVLSANLLGDTLRDFLAPRFRDIVS